MTRPMETGDNHAQTRREFCTHTCQVASLAALGGVFGSLVSACAGSPTSPSNVPSLSTISGSLAGGNVTVSIDSASPLASIGGAALVTFGAGSLLVVRATQDSFTALSSTCTHQTCTITGFGSQLFVCPCHGSQFDTTGRVVMGPAIASLKQYPTSFNNNVLTITT